MTKIRYCEYCGSTLLPNAAFCENCGRPVRPLKKKTGNGQNPAGRKAPVRPESGNKEQRTENREKRGIFLENVKKIPNYAGLELTSGIFLDTIRLQQDICRYNFGTMAREFLP